MFRFKRINGHDGFVGRNLFRRFEAPVRDVGINPDLQKTEISTACHQHQLANIGHAK